MLLPDINVWVALAFTGHKHHPPVQEWFKSVATSSAFFCRLTQQGFLRLLSNQTVARHEVLSLAEAWRVYDRFMADPRIEFAEEPKGVESQWRAYTHSDLFSPKVWNDAYLAAFARQAGYEIVTFDQGFKVYEGVERTILQ